MKTLQINKEFRDLIPPLTKEEYEGLIVDQLTELNKIQDHYNFNSISKRICSVCHWFFEDVSIDRHHLIHRTENGSNDKINIIYLCPNCHRIIHTLEKDILPFMFDFMEKDDTISDYKSIMYDGIYSKILEPSYDRKEKETVAINLTNILFVKYLFNKFKEIK
jgi:hypothetical protein